MSDSVASVLFPDGVRAVNVGLEMFARLQQRDASHRQRCQYIRYRIEFIDAQRLEVITQRGFDRAFPAAAHRQLRRETWLLCETGAGQPLGGARVAALQCRLLQSFE